jgi:hypothetical protein
VRQEGGGHNPGDKEMSFKSIVASNSTMTELDSSLNPSLADYPGAQVVNAGLSWGNSKNRAGILLDVSENGSGSVVKSKALSDSDSLESLEEQVQSWLASNAGEITILGLELIKSNDKWKTLILFTDDAPVVTYTVDYELEDKASDEQSGIDAELAGAASVVAFGFAYGNNNYGALFIYSL